MQKNVKGNRKQCGADCMRTASKALLSNNFKSLDAIESCRQNNSLYAWSSLAGQPFHKRQEGSGVMPIHELY